MKVKEVRELNEEVSPMQALTSPVELPRTAFSIARSGDGLWNLVQIKFDVNSRAVGPVEILRTDENHGIIVEAFKLQTSYSGLFSG